MIQHDRAERHPINDGQASRIINLVLDRGGVWSHETNTSLFVYYAERSFIRIKPGQVCFCNLPTRVAEDVKLILEGKK